MTTALGRSLILSEAANAAGRTTVFRFDDAVREGDPGEGLFLVLCGMLLASMPTAHGERIVATLTTGDVFGASPCISGGGAVNPVTVTAMRPSSVAFLPDDVVRQLIEAHPVFEDALRAVVDGQARERIDVLSALLTVETAPID